MLPTPNKSAEFVIFIYCYFDDIWPKVQAKLLKRKNQRGKAPNLTFSETLTLGCLFGLSGISTLKRFYEYVQAVWGCWFRLPNYQNFVAGINRSLGFAMACLQHLLHVFRQQFKAHALDSTSLAVCRIKRANRHRVCLGLATKGYSTMGWFFGFKLHAVVSREGYLLAIVITPGNVDDRAPVEQLVSDLSACIIVADAGYLSAELRAKLLKQGVHLFYATKKNMKKLMTNFQHCLLKSRQIIETVFGMLKERMHLVSHLSRSVVGHLARYIFCLLAYQMKCLAKLLMI